jgi:hypothetical protein
MTLSGGSQDRQFAYYVPDWIWPDDRIDFRKQMLLFFDGLSMSLPQRHFEQTVEQREREIVNASGSHKWGFFMARPARGSRDTRFNLLYHA